MDSKFSINLLSGEQWKIEGVIIALISAAFIYHFGHATFPDTATYIVADPFRTSGYPTIISLFKLLFGGYYLTAISYVQFFLYIFVSIRFATLLCLIFDVNVRLRYVLLLILCLPISPAHQYGNAILTEAFAFVVSLMIIYQAYKAYTLSRYSDYFVLFLYLAVAITLRPQMAYFIITFVVVGGLLLVTGHAKKALMYIMVAVVSFLSASTIDKTYHYFQHGFFGQIPFVGTQLIVLPFFTMSEQTIDHIENREDKHLILKMVDLAESRGLRQNTHVESEVKPYRPIFDYAAKYNVLRMQVIHRVIEDAQPGLSPKEMDGVLIRLSTSIFKSGLQNEPIAYAKAYANNLIYLGFGSPLYFIIYLTTFLTASVLFLRQQNPVWFLSVVISLAHFINIAVVTVLQPVMFRYSFYTELPMTVLMVILVIVAITYNRASNQA